MWLIILLLIIGGGLYGLRLYLDYRTKDKMITQPEAESKRNVVVKLVDEAVQQVTSKMNNAATQDPSKVHTESFANLLNLGSKNKIDLVGLFGHADLKTMIQNSIAKITAKK